MSDWTTEEKRKPRGDLIIEEGEWEAASGIHAPSHSEYVTRGYTVSHAETAEGASYHTLLAGRLWLAGEGDRRRCVLALTDLLLKYLTKAGFCLRGGRVLFCGLGNAAITADSLGPLVCDGLFVSGRDAFYRRAGFTELYAVKPGVPAKTGIPTGEQVRVMAEHLRADVILTADAVAARTVKRLSTVVQVTDGGVRAGSGAGLHADEISAATMPCPVISIGVPTVIRSSVLLGDALASCGVDPAYAEKAGGGEEFLVSHSEIDLVVSAYATLIAGAVNRLFTVETP